MDLVSVNVGDVQQRRNARGSMAATGLHKQPTTQPVVVGPTGLANDASACIGDVLRVGSALLQVNQPVVRCSWPTTLAAEPRLTKWVTKAGLTGIYLNVLQTGTIAQGDNIELDTQGNPKFTVAYLNAVLRNAKTQPLEAAELLKLPSLAERWKVNLRKAL